MARERLTKITMQAFRGVRDAYEIDLAQAEGAPEEREALRAEAADWCRRSLQIMPDQPRVQTWLDTLQSPTPRRD